MGKRARRPRKVSQTLISYTAQRYLSRYMATEMRLRQVLSRKINKRLWEREQQLSLSSEVIEAERDAAQTLIDAEVQRLIEQGQVNDHRSATTWMRNYLNQGKSALQMRQALIRKGLSREVIETVMAEVIQSQSGDVALRSALTYARRRRFGPYRRMLTEPEVERRQRFQRQLASMMRAGHAYAVSRRILECESDDEAWELEEEARGEGGLF